MSNSITITENMTLSKIKLLLLKMLNETENFVVLLFHQPKLKKKHKFPFVLFN